MSLQEKAMLVTLSVSCWTARKQDKKVAAEVEASHNAKDAGRYNKLLIDKHHLDPLTTFAGSIRAYHYRMTLPWMDNGARLLPSKLFLEYSAEIRKLQGEYTKLVDALIQIYPRLVQEARQRLGTMYDPTDYPDVSELSAKFGVELDIVQVPDGQDFRVDVSETEKQRIAAEITSRVAARQRAAITAAWDRVRETVSLVALRLSAEKAVIRDSLVDNTQELCRLLPGLNINNDPVMENVCQLITDKLIVSPDRLRRSASLRKATATEAEKILQMIPC